MYFLNGVMANLTANFGIQLVFTLFGLSSFSLLALNQKDVSLISEDKVNCLHNFLQITYNWTSFSFLI